MIETQPRQGGETAHSGMGSLRPHDPTSTHEPTTPMQDDNPHQRRLRDQWLGQGAQNFGEFQLIFQVHSSLMCYPLIQNYKHVCWCTNHILQCQLVGEEEEAAKEDKHRLQVTDNVGTVMEKGLESWIGEI